MISPRKLLTVFLLVFLIFADFFIWQKVYATKSDDSNLKVYFLDVGQGDATLIEAPNGNQLLIDGGPLDNSVLRELGDVLDPLDRDLDMVLATHPDADHIGGLPEVFKRFTVSFYVESGNKTKDTKAFSSLEKVVSEEVGLEKVLARAGQVIVLDDTLGREVLFEIFYPDRDVSFVESNEASIVGKLVFGNVCFIFTGDAPKDVEANLLSLYGNILDCEVLKVGHHGSKTSSLESFVKTVSPEVAVISDGKDNRYGHPNKEVLDILNKNKIEVLRTDEVGRVILESDGLNIFVR